jgi:hypothetical protein
MKITSLYLDLRGMDWVEIKAGYLISGQLLAFQNRREKYYLKPMIKQ